MSLSSSVRPSVCRDLLPIPPGQSERNITLSLSTKGQRKIISMVQVAWPKSLKKSSPEPKVHGLETWYVSSLTPALQSEYKMTLG